VITPRGSGASEGSLPSDYVNVSRWVSPTEAAQWISSGGTAIPAGIGAGSRVYVTAPNAPKPGGTGMIRIDFAVPLTSIQLESRSGDKLCNQSRATPIYNVKINVPNGVGIPGIGK
jgi:filamentous hemagglutinin